MSPIILFNHIPKTGGTTLRIILNKVYGKEKVYFPNSTDLPGSYQKFEKLSPELKNSFHVIAGHGAEYYSNFYEKPLKLTILRDPVELFFSQYYYLKASPNSIFQEEVQQLESIEAYLDFAITHGQDNLLTRYISNSIDWLITGSNQIPNMEKEGAELLETAKRNLHKYDAVLSLNKFDRGVYALKNLLKWKSIPLYRPANKTKEKTTESYPEELMEKLRFLLRFDIDLYNYFLNEKLDIGLKADSKEKAYKLFMLRQKPINKIF